MNRLYPTDAAGFSRQYRFAGGKLRRVKVRFDANGKVTVDFSLIARSAMKQLGVEPRPVRLRIRITDVEEFRIQKRPNGGTGKISDARFGYFEDLIFVNLDAWSLEPGEQPKVHDFRSSDTYVAGRDVWWEEVKNDQKA